MNAPDTQSRWNPSEDRQWHPLLSIEEVEVLKWLTYQGPQQLAWGAPRFGAAMNLIDRRLIVESEHVPRLFYITPAGINVMLNKSRHSGKRWHFLDIFPDGHPMLKRLGEAMGRALAGADGPGEPAYFGWREFVDGLLCRW